MGHGKPRTRAGGHLSGALGCKHVVHGAVTCRKRSGGARRARAGRAGVRGSGVGRRATGGRCVGAAAAHIRVSLVSAQVGRVIGAPVSRRRQGRDAAHRRRLGRARVPSGVAAAGHVWGHRSALEFFVLHLSPDAMAQPVINEGEVGRERRRVLGWAQVGCGAGRTIGGSTFRRAGSQGGSGERAGSEGFARGMSGWYDQKAIWVSVNSARYT